MDSENLLGNSPAIERLTPEFVEKLYRIFESTYQERQEYYEDDEANWLDLLDQHACLLFFHDNVASALTYADFVNYVCIENPANDKDWYPGTDSPFRTWIMVPKDTAEKIVVLGFLPP